MVPLDLARPSDRQGADSLRIGRVGHVEQAELGAGRAAFVGGVLADAEQQPVADGVEVGRVAGDLQFAGLHRVGGVGEIDHVERIDLTERDDIGELVDEPHGVDLLVLAEPADRRDLRQVVAVGSQHEHGRLALLAEPAPVVGGGGHPQVAVELAHRELVEQASLHLARGDIGRRRAVIEAELMDQRRRRTGVTSGG